MGVKRRKSCILLRSEVKGLHEYMEQFRPPIKPHETCARECLVHDSRKCKRSRPAHRAIHQATCQRSCGRLALRSLCSRFTISMCARSHL